MARIFISYRELLLQMQDDLASGAWRTLSSYSLNGRSFTYRSFAEWQKIFEFVREEAAIETGRAPYRGRMFAGQGARR